jgi:prepilin-type N-terminal cleavage/methylation domain-containing protein
MGRLVFYPRSSMRRRTESAGHSRGFTLLELLVVIAIVAVLLGIVLPVLGSVRETAKKTVCAANLRSLGQGINSCVSDHDSAYPCAYAFNCNNYYPAPGITHWSGQLVANGYSSEVAFHCPSFARGGLPPTDTTPDNLEPGQVNNESSYLDCQARRCAYTVNEAICPQPFFLADPPPHTPMAMCHYVGSTNVDLHTNRLYHSVGAAAIEAPEATILVTEWQQNWRLVSGPGYCNAGQSVSLSYRPVHGFAPITGNSLDPFDVSLVLPAVSGTPALRRLTAGDVAPHPTPPGWQQPRPNWLGRNHDWATITNFAYVDTHVEAKPIEQTLHPFEWGREFYSLCPGNDLAAYP